MPTRLLQIIYCSIVPPLIAYINALILFLLAVHMKVKYYSGLMVLQFVEFCICSCNVGWPWFIIIVIMGG